MANDTETTETEAEQRHNRAEVKHPLGATDGAYDIPGQPRLEDVGAALRIMQGGRASESQETIDRAEAKSHAQVMLELSAELPLSIAGGMTATHAALLRWRGLATEAREAATRFYAHDMLGSSVRVKCTELLQLDEYEPAQPSDGFSEGAQVLKRKAMSYSAADKAASDHPLYQAHKAEAHRRAVAMKATELAAQAALETLHCQQLYLKALVKLEQLEDRAGFEPL